MFEIIIQISEHLRTPYGARSGIIEHLQVLVFAEHQWNMPNVY